MKTGTLSLEIKYAFDDWDGDLWIDDLKQAIGKTLFLYGKDYQGHLRLADRNPNKSALWND